MKFFIPKRYYGKIKETEAKFLCNVDTFSCGSRGMQRYDGTGGYSGCIFETIDSDEYFLTYWALTNPFNLFSITDAEYDELITGEKIYFDEIRKRKFIKSWEDSCKVPNI
jgi:hypothetical protein